MKVGERVWGRYSGKPGVVTSVHPAGVIVHFDEDPLPFAVMLHPWLHLTTEDPGVLQRPTTGPWSVNAKMTRAINCGDKFIALFDDPQMAELVVNKMNDDWNGTGYTVPKSFNEEQASLSSSLAVLPVKPTAIDKCMHSMQDWEIHTRATFCTACSCYIDEESRLIERRKRT